MEISRDGDRLFATEPGKPAQPLTPLSPTRFWVEGGLAPVQFERDATGRAMRLHSDEEAEVVLERVPEP